MGLDVLRSIKTLVTHKPCPDGAASALIVKDALPDVEVVALQYGTPEHVAFEPRPGVLFCDFTPWVEREPPAKSTSSLPPAVRAFLPSVSSEPPAMTDRGLARARAWADVGAAVLDHHRGAADLVAVFGDRGVHADEKARPGVSGALLAYEEVWEPLWRVGGTSCAHPSDARAFAELAGVRDTWQTKSPRWRAACAQAAALEFWPFEQLLREGLPHVMRHRLDVGESLLQKQAESDRETVGELLRLEALLPLELREALRVTGLDAPPATLRVACFEGRSREASDVADLLGDDVDMVVAWHYFMRGDRSQIRLSCRSRGVFKCAPFVQSLGGNGHDHAAGCVVPLSMYQAGHQYPYSFIDSLVRRFLAVA